MIIDIHVHPYISAQDDFSRILHEAEKYDARLWVYSLLPRSIKPPVHWLPTADYCRRANDDVVELMRQYPERVEGFAYVNPLVGELAVKELDRCVGEHSMIGMKLWIAVRCSDPVVDPLIDRCAHHGIPMLQHTWLKATGNMPGESTPMDLAVLARRHPDATLIMGHSGGDWEYGVRCARSLEKVFFDISGGEANSGWIERAVDLVGAERILFGTDMPGRSMSSQLAKVLGARISDDAKEKITYKNAAGILERARQARPVAAR
jgi:predicted TIM-barrel fold metal-dependent hydrolase